MCLYPKLIINGKYKPNKKNGYNAPQIKDIRTMYVPVGCQKCIECKTQKARAWSIRLQEEIRENKTGQFVTLTFSNESILEIMNDLEIKYEGYELDNAIATLATRRFLERWRKKYKKSVKHWLITELGQGGKTHKGTENIHLHGIIFTEHREEIEKIWKYGFVYVGEYVNERTINYCVKYSTQIDELHPNYHSKILTSPGIGSNYINRIDAKTNKYNKNGTDERYTTRQGAKMNLPIYYRNKIYTEEEREKLWLEKLDKEERWVMGNKVSTKNGPEQYYKELEHAQRKNKEMGYGDDTKDWEQFHYEQQRRKINIQKRLDKLEKNNNLES